MPKAPRYCPGDEGHCRNLITTQRYCPQHTPPPWQGPRTASSTITSTTAWKQLATKILHRDHHQCRIRYPGICVGHATVVDKIIPAAKRPDLALDEANCQAACQPCNDHKARTADRRR